jgi:Thioredoxin
VTARLIVLAITVAIGAIGIGIYAYFRTRGTGGPDRLNVGDLGLELMSGCCAFVVFTSPACRPCKTALKVVGDAADKSSGLTEVTTVDAIDRPDLATRYSVRTIPTVFLITASGHVLRRWKNVPDPGDVADALAAV